MGGGGLYNQTFHLDCSWDTIGPDIRRGVIYPGWMSQFIHKDKVRWTGQVVVIYEEI